MKYRTRYFISIILFISASVSLQAVSYAASCSKDETYFNMGNKYVREQFHDRAIEMFTKFIESNMDIQPEPDCRKTATANLAAAYYNRGNTYLFKLFADRAIDDFTEAIKFNGNVPNYYYYRGLAHAKSVKGAPELRKKRQMADLARATKLDPNYGLKALFMLGHDLITYKVVPEYPGETDDVKTILDAGMGINLADAEGRRALMYAAAWGHAETVKLLLAKGADPALRDNKGNSALMLAVAEKRDNTVGLLEPAAKGEKDYYSLALFYLDKKKADSANAHIEHAIKLDNGNPVTRLLQGDIFMAMKDYARAISSYQKALELEPDNKTALSKLSLCYSSKAAEGAPEKYPTLANKAISHLQVGETDIATDLFGRALDLLLKEMEREKNPNRYQSASWYSLFVSRFRDAEKFAGEGLNMDNRAYTLRLNLGHALLLQGRQDDALTEYRKYLEHDRAGSVTALLKTLNEDMALLRMRYPEKKSLFDWVTAQLYFNN